ncbi:MAG TPA: L-aspartate oxidase [Thermoleophilia bacterium]|nr:L-aspartate oxidase [Thermoleophilia bacterium]
MSPAPRPYIASVPDRPLLRRQFDVLVLGGGIAGLTAAIAAARRWRVGLLTKASLNDTTTFLAQGGIAAALGESDSPELHFQDTVDAGAGLCDPDAVRVLVNEGPDRVRELIEICPRFDRQDGEIVLGREGAHSVRRVAHAGGDATGREVSSTLSEAARLGSRVQLYEDEFVIDLLTIDGRCIGALSLNLKDGEYTLNLAMVTILATGGAGQVYARTTNPEVATGDGVAMAYRAGASIRDLEFVQFHPTGLAVTGSPTPLITEALRGEGALLRNAAGERFMTTVDPKAELAARDVVVRGMSAEMRREGSSHVYLDATALDGEMLRSRFPRVTALLSEHDLDLSRDLIPVAPVAHFFIGGVVTDVWGRTTVPGLYAAGEVASTGVHGANRLASNSLLEGLVFGDRVVRHLDRYIGGLGEDVRRLHFELPAPSGRTARHSDIAAVRRAVTGLMSERVGWLRTEDGLLSALGELRATNSALQFGDAGPPEFELLNILTLATQITKCALLREETRGVHVRDDHPGRDDYNWQRHITLRLPGTPATESRR